MTDPSHHTVPVPECAPAGDMESMRAAVSNGADAVYFGLPRFSARQRAENFALADLPGVVDYLHGHNVKGYVAFNTLVFSDELPEAAKYVEAICQAGVDAVIVQDLGLLRLIRRMAPDLPIHASTQMTQTEPRGIELLRELGVRRVILARELSMEQVRQVARATAMELEVFVHGALCVSFSGQCLASLSLWGRSANRGLCGQACRLPYELIVEGQKRDLGGANYLLSPQDLAAWDLVAELVAAGVAGLKIEGRLKSAHYVASATRTYRAVLDAAIQGQSAAVSRQQAEELAQCFSRGFTRGFLGGAGLAEQIPGRYSKSRGIRLGVVAAVTERGVVVDLSAPGGEIAVQPGDGVVFDEGRPQSDEQGGRVYEVKFLPRWTGGSTKLTAGGSTPLPASGGRRAEIAFGRDDVDLSAVAVGAIVWKTDDPRLRQELDRTFNRDRIVRRVGLQVRAAVDAAGRLHLTATDADGNAAQAVSDEPLPAAVTQPLDVELLREQFCRLGNTPFELTGVELARPGRLSPAGGVLAPKSLLNALRRRIVEDLLNVRKRRAVRQIVEPGALAALAAEQAALGAGAAAGPQAVPVPPSRPRLYVLVRALDQLQALLEIGAAVDMVYCDMQAPADSAQAVATARRAGLPAALATTRVLMPGQEAGLARMVELAPDAMLVRNLGALSLLRSAGPPMPLILDYSLNAANELAVGLLAACGGGRVTAACDVDFARLSALLGRTPAAGIEVVAHQHIPMFHTAHELAAWQPGGATGGPGPGRGKAAALRDRVGVEHPMLTDRGGRTTVFHGRPQTAALLLPRLIALGARHFRIELVAESPPHAVKTVKAYADLLAGRAGAEETWTLLREDSPTGLTSGSWEAPSARSEVGAAE